MRRERTSPTKNARNQSSRKFTINRAPPSAPMYHPMGHSTTAKVPGSGSLSDRKAENRVTGSTLTRQQNKYSTDTNTHPAKTITGLPVQAATSTLAQRRDHPAPGLLSRAAQLDPHKIRRQIARQGLLGI